MNSFISWVGGKKLLRREICARFPEKFDRYVEVFGGAAWVLFHKDRHAKTEVYNDINSNLVNLFKCVKYHPNAIAEELGLMLNAREIFNDYKDLYTRSSMTDIQRAARFLYMIRASYGSKASSFSGKPRDISNVEYLTLVRERLKNVIIENRNFDTLIKQYDSESALFYCDPPYHGTERFYDTGDNVFDDEQHIRLNALLRGLKGKCVVSYNDSGFIRDLYKDFVIDEVERVNNLATRYGTGKRYKELIIRNYQTNCLHLAVDLRGV